MILRSKDHPRVGGEKTVIENQPCKLSGSPPRGRGKEENADENRQAHGITPAWAGKRRSSSRWGKRCWDHPRVGGEKTKKIP